MWGHKDRDTMERRGNGARKRTLLSGGLLAVALLIGVLGGCQVPAAQQQPGTASAAVTTALSTATRQFTTIRAPATIWPPTPVGQLTPATNAQYTITLRQTEWPGQVLRWGDGQEARAQGQWLVVEVRVSTPPTTLHEIVPPLVGSEFVVRAYAGEALYRQTTNAQVRATYATARGGQPPTVPVTPGTTVVYYLCFEVPADAPHLYLTYSTSFDSQGFPLFDLGQ
jgi:hypothetical protein